MTEKNPYLSFCFDAVKAFYEMCSLAQELSVFITPVAHAILIRMMSSAYGQYIDFHRLRHDGELLAEQALSETGANINLIFKNCLALPLEDLSAFSGVRLDAFIEKDCADVYPPRHKDRPKTREEKRLEDKQLRCYCGLFLCCALLIALKESGKLKGHRCLTADPYYSANYSGAFSIKELCLDFIHLSRMQNDLERERLELLLPELTPDFAAQFVRYRKYLADLERGKIQTFKDKYAEGRDREDRRSGKKTAYGEKDDKQINRDTAPFIVWGRIMRQYREITETVKNSEDPSLNTYNLWLDYVQKSATEKEGIFIRYGGLAPFRDLISSPVAADNPATFILVCFIMETAGVLENELRKADSLT